MDFLTGVLCEMQACVLSKSTYFGYEHYVFPFFMPCSCCSPSCLLSTSYFQNLFYSHVKAQLISSSLDLWTTLIIVHLLFQEFLFCFHLYDRVLSVFPTLQDMLQNGNMHCLSNNQRLNKCNSLLYVNSLFQQWYFTGSLEKGGIFIISE